MSNIKEQFSQHLMEIEDQVEDFFGYLQDMKNILDKVISEYQITGKMDPNALQYIIHLRNYIAHVLDEDKTGTAINEISQYIQDLIWRCEEKLSEDKMKKLNDGVSKALPTINSYKKKELD